MSTDLRAIAFYLPQFHPVRENDEWWGTGFTEWRNVAKARPLFAGHYQPHLPADLGFYDLRLPEIREAQATLARDHGLHGFCYYHYWFNGRRILERPFNEVLASGKPNFPFCLCWANENWTRAWNGGEKDILLGQQYNHADDLTHINSLFPAFEDARYIRINGKPLFIVYRTQLMPNPARTAEIWREAALKAGIGELYLARVESFGEDLNPETIGFDADIEFAPNWRRLGSPLHRDRFSRWLIKLGVLPDVYLKQTVATYEGMIQGMLSKPVPNHVRFRGVTPGFDNSARRAEGAAILVESKPEKYAGWLREIARQTLQKQQGDERLIFINAWNEWAEGNHLEPDLQNGHAYLQATADVLRPLNV
ncbi:MAG: glycoside hydrolase family 99-like domain-containing protein [Pseudomonadota bacterium]